MIALGMVAAFAIYGQVQEVFYVAPLQLTVFAACGLAAALEASNTWPSPLFCSSSFSSYCSTGVRCDRGPLSLDRSETVVVTSGISRPGRDPSQPDHDVVPVARGQQESDGDEHFATDPRDPVAVTPNDGKRTEQVAQPKSEKDERDAEAEASLPPQAPAPLPTDPCTVASPTTAAKVGTVHRIQPSAKTAPSSGAAVRPEAGSLPDPYLTVQARHHAEEGQAHHDDQHADDPLDQLRVVE